jgi:excisionase family DNA binding protein
MDAALSALDEHALAAPARDHPQLRFLSVDDVAKMLDVHPSTVYRWLGNGLFPSRAFRVGGRWRIDGDAFVAWVAAQ